jgi:CubicO group peptidase (beta-lactamase class C family)
MLRYLRYNMGQLPTDLNTLLPMLQKRWHQAMRPGTWVGLAWQMAPLQPGSDLIKMAKNGGTAGFHSHITFVKETQTGVVMIANTAVKGTLDRTAVRILRVLNQGSERDADIEEPVDEPEEPQTGS